MKDIIRSVDFSKEAREAIEELIKMIDIHVFEYVQARITVDELKNTMQVLMIQAYGAIHVSQKKPQ